MAAFPQITGAKYYTKNEASKNKLAHLQFHCFSLLPKFTEPIHSKMYLFHYFGLAIFGILALISILATLLPFIPSKVWWIRAFDYPRLQTFYIAVIGLTWFGVFYFKQETNGYIAAGLFIIVIIIQGYKAWPYTPFAKKEVLLSEGDPEDNTPLSLFICNVYQENKEYGAVLEKIQQFNPDLIITTESDSLWQEGLSSLTKDYPYLVPVPQANTYGMHLYSRLPLQNTDVRFLVEKDIPSIRTQVQLSSGEWITLFVVHPRPPGPSEAPDTEERDAELVMVAKEAREEKGGVLVAGDFNDVAWSETTKLFQEVSGLLDPRKGRGFFNTFHAKIPIFRWPLDHVFHSPHFKLDKLKRVGPVNSDHFPMYIKLSYEPEEKADQPEVEPDEDTEEKAQKAINKEAVI